MKRLLFISPHLSTGGLPQYLVKKVELLQNEYDIFVVEYSDVTGGRLVVQRNRLISLLKNPLITLGEDKSELLNVIRQINPHIVHMEEIPEMFCDNHIANQIYDLNRTYSIYETSHDSSFDVHYKRYIADKMILVSDYQRKLYEPLNIPIEVIDYPIEFSKENRKEEYMRELGLDTTKKHILNVGLFTPRKNQKEFFEYARRMPDYQFHSVGNMADNFKFYWEPLLKDVPPNLKIWDERSDVHKFFEAMDLFLFTSRGSNSDKETMPLVLKEAVASKIPICLYNLEVYEGFFNQFNNIYYLNFDDVLINDATIRNSIGSVTNPYEFHTLTGLVDFSKFQYPNSMYETIQRYGGDAGMYWGQFVFQELDKFGVSVEPGDVYVDLGANIGMSARYAQLKGASKIYCVEPDLHLIELLKKNVPNSIVFNNAIGQLSGNIELYHWPYNDVEIGPKYTVQTVTLKEILNEVGKIDYLKVDIEGYEEHIFDVLTTEECSNIRKIFIEHHNSDTFNLFCEKLRNVGYEVYVEYGAGQNYVYGVFNNQIKESVVFNCRWDWDTQKMYYSVSKTLDFPILVSLREYKSNAVTWSSRYDSLHGGVEYWMMPVHKSVNNYQTSEWVSGIKLCIYDERTGKQLYEYPFFNKFVDIPTIDLSNSIPYYINYLEFFVNDKYKKYFNRAYDTVVDVGANVGVFTSYLLHKRVCKKVISVECDSRALVDLKSNFYTNPLVTVIDKALHYDNSQLEFYEDIDNPIVSSAIPVGSFTYHNDGFNKNRIKRTLDTITLKEITDMYGIIDLLKIDIEGGEYSIFDKADGSVLDKINHLLIECHFFEDDYMQKYENLLIKLKNAGFLVEEYESGQAEKCKGGSEVIFATKVR